MRAGSAWRRVWGWTRSCFLETTADSPDGPSSFPRSCSRCSKAEPDASSALGRDGRRLTPWGTAAAPSPRDGAEPAASCLQTAPEETGCACSDALAALLDHSGNPVRRQHCDQQRPFLGGPGADGDDLL